jgi:hypothetical protein
MIGPQNLSIALPFVLLIFWMVFVVQLIFSLFGVSLPLNPFKRRQVKLSLSQSIFLNGIFGYSAGMFLFTTSLEYFDWKLNGASPDHLTFGRIVLNASLWLAFGFVFGCMAYALQKKGQEPSRPPA